MNTDIFLLDFELDQCGLTLMQGYSSVADYKSVSDSQCSFAKRMRFIVALYLVCLSCYNFSVNGQP